MRLGTSVARGVLYCAVLAILSLSASAGPLNGHLNAYNDGVNPVWTGTTLYNDGTGTLAGTVDWAVFDAAGFGLSGLTGIGGWTPNPGQFVYAYQINNTGIAPVSSYALTIINPAGNIGALNTTQPGQVPSSASLTSPGAATWGFSPSFAGASSGLVYSSLNPPMNFLSSIVDFGISTFVVPVPSPVPEPGSGALLVFGLAILFLVNARHRMWQR